MNAAASNFLPLNDRPDWTVLQHDWPNSDKSHFVENDHIIWHLQSSRLSKGLKALLLHGTGASTHSVARLFKVLSIDYNVTTLDLPGHGFTAGAKTSDLSLTGMSQAISGLLGKIEFSPDIVVGHSAGAAIALQMAADGLLAPAHIVGVNAALKPIEGNALFAPLAKLLFVNPLTPRLFSMQAKYTSAANNLIKATNSPVDNDTLKRYRTLMENPAHVNGALGMMANWDLQPLIDRFPTIDMLVTLVVAKDDKMVPPYVSRDAAARLPKAHLVSVERGGHLLHEVNEEVITRLLDNPVEPPPHAQRASQ